MSLLLPDAKGTLGAYTMKAEPIVGQALSPEASRVVFAAAHVVADPLADADPSGAPALDWQATLAFRRHLHGLGLGIAEAMDTSQRGMGFDWPTAFELIKQTRQELPDALVFNGAGTDQLEPEDARDLGQVEVAYGEQIEAIQAAGGRMILMASRALARVATSPADYKRVYKNALAACDQPIILHWLGDMFDPALAGYWGSHDFEAALETCLEIIDDNKAKVDGIKISLLDKDKEIAMRRRLPAGVRMYTGDDFNYPELIAGDEQGFSHALLGIFDPLAGVAAAAINRLDTGDRAGYHALMDPTVPLAREIFRAPTQYYKTGVVFLAWLNGLQDHFVMIQGHQAMRSLPYFAQVFRYADQAGVLMDPDLAQARMRRLLALYGVEG